MLLSMPVSISQSRCFSFQAFEFKIGEFGGDAGFNLAIEMLFISGKPVEVFYESPYGSFNLAIEMLFISG